jgi:SAM-dependent methyltransferase
MIGSVMSPTSGWTMSVYDVGRFSLAHELVIEAVPPGASVLELGANTGYMSARLRAKGCPIVAGEYDRECLPLLAERADEVFWCDLNEPDGLAHVEGRQFDAVVLADVLEHLTNPTDVLRRCSAVLAPRGRVVVSMPNIAFHAIRLDLLRGRFPRPETGILDRTHLHFFTRETAELMFAAAGFMVDTFAVAEDVPLDKKLARATSDNPTAKAAKVRFNKWIAKRMPGLLGYQFVWTLRDHEAG